VDESTTAPAPIWIATQPELDHFAKHARSHSLLGLDTEFIRTQTFHAELGLVQIASGHSIALVDPLIGDLKLCLSSLVGDAALTKIVHSASEDLEVLSHALGTVAAPLFDTQIAAVLCGYEQPPSYQKLVAQELDISLDKQATRTDWLKRPLDTEQLRYAAEDVLHLAPLYQTLSARLQSLGRLAWMAEECQRAVDKSRQALDPFPHLKIRGAERMNPAQQGRLWRLLHWRDREAMARNRPKKWILDNPVALRAALLERADLAALEAAVAADGRPSAKLAHKIEQILKHAPTAEELNIPLSLTQNELEKTRARDLREHAVVAAQALSLSVDFLLPRRGLDYWARHGLLPEDLRGWRNQVLWPA